MQRIDFSFFSKKIIKTSLLFCCSFLLLGPKTFALEQEKKYVNFNEVYELANIILALTEHGLTDKNEVNKASKYYQEVLTYFDAYKTHPIIQKANYSRELWDKFLSFRTDAVAFQFNKENQLIRQHEFYAMGKNINEFETHLELINDFAQQSNFRAFYKSKQAFFEDLQLKYESSLMMEEIQSFLSHEFKTSHDLNLQLIVSPLVGRMHCQRFFNEKATSFVNVPAYLFSINNIEEADPKVVAMGLHVYFTEIDHDYVNPTTRVYKKLCKKKFKAINWDKDSGYVKNRFGTFNEYMTWAVYDLFVKKYFPKVAEEVSEKWHKINQSRGFFASQKFGEQLTTLYMNKSKEETIYDLYPKLLDWCMRVQHDLE